jgi:tetratricopeptide (TPR) repeat protein
MSTPNSVILIVERENDLTPQEQAIRDRLGNVLGYEVRLQSSERNVVCTDGQAAGAALVVVCSRHVSGDLRELDLPVLACNPNALFDLGMTMGKAKVDFGTQLYSTVFIGPDAIGDQSAIMGRRQVTDDQVSQGWAKPGPKALVLATVGGDSSKAVAFAYDKGASMPGLDAIHRRGAFLATGDTTGQMKPDAWRLFDLVVQGVAEGRKWEEHPGPAGVWFLKDGTPTRSLSAEEYRDWVEERVAKKVMTRFTWLGLGSVTAIVGMIALVTSWIKGQVDEKVDMKLNAITAMGIALNDKVDSTTKSVHATVEKELAQLKGDVRKDADESIRTQIGSLRGEMKAETQLEMARLIFAEEKNEKAGIRKAVGDKLVEILPDFIERTPEVQARLVEALTTRTADALIHHYKQQHEAKKLQPHKRKALLQMIDVHATGRQRDEFRALVRDVLMEEGVAEPALAAALELFESSNSRDDRTDFRKMIVSIYPRLTSPALKDPFGSFLGRFSDDEAEFLLNWLYLEKKAKLLYAEPARSFLSGVARLRPTKEDSQVLGVLLRFALGKDSAKSQWAIGALSQISPFLQLEDKAIRQRAMTDVIDIIDRPFVNESGITDPDGNYRRLGPVLGAIMRLPDDEDYLRKKISRAELGAGGAELAPKRGVQALFKEWALKLRNSDRQAPAKLLGDLNEVEDVFNGEGTGILIIESLRSGERDQLTTFFERVPAWWTKAETTVARSPGVGDVRIVALSTAVERDSIREGKSAFWRTTRLLKRLQEESIENKVKIKDQLRLAIGSYCFASQRRAEDLFLLRDALKAASKRHQMYTEFADVERALTNWVRRWASMATRAEALARVGAVIEAVGESPEAVFARAALLGDLEQYDNAVTDLGIAIQGDGNEYRYYEWRGDIHRKQGNITLAVADYEDARGRLEGDLLDLKDEEKTLNKGDKDYNLMLNRLQSGTTTLETRLRNLYHKLMKARLREEVNPKVSSDEKLFEQAEREVKRLLEGAVKSTYPRDKAGSQENLGLFYLKHKKWDKAWKNSGDVTELYSDMSWNWMIRYIAAKESGRDDLARVALGKWDDLRQGKGATKVRIPTDWAGLNDIIPDLLRTHFGVKEVLPDRLQATTTAEVPKFGKCVAKTHDVACQKGKTYVVDMESTVLDSYLVLKDPDGQTVIADDHGGGGRNARIPFTAKMDGNYQIIATSYGGRAHGAYTLIIREPPGQNTTTK